MRKMCLASLALATACGGVELVERPLEIEVLGLSSRAVSLELKVRKMPASPDCRVMTAAAANNAEAGQSQLWSRMDGSVRMLALPTAGQESVQILLIAKNSEDRPFQFACREVDFAAIESPEVTLTLEGDG